jgi:hypothetical protein
MPARVVDAVSSRTLLGRAWVEPMMPAIYHIFSDQVEIGLKLFCEKTVIKGGSSFQEEMLLNHKLPESEGQ